MFIYSNHYLILSKITQEDFKDYFTHADKKVDYNVIDETTYLKNDFIDLAICEYESYDYIQFLEDPINYKRDLRYHLLPVINSDRKHYYEADNSVHIYDDLNKYKVYIHEEMHYSTNSEFFYPLYLFPASHTFYLVPSTLNDPDAEEEEIIEDLRKRESRITHSYYNIKLDYKEEDLERKSFRHPKHQMVNPNNPEIVFLLGDREYYGYPGEYHENINYGIAPAQINHIINSVYILDNDLNDQEYWHEPTFVFPLIREMFLNENEKNKDIFPLSYTAPTGVDRYTNPAFDNNVERFA